MVNDILELTKALVGMKTPCGDIRRLNRCIDFIMDYYHGIARVKRFQYNRFPSLMISNYVRPNLILNAHIDVVGADESMFTPRIKGDKLYGRGAFDSKAQVAAFMQVMKENPNSSIGLMITSDGEVGGKWGTGRLAKEYPCKFAIVGEATNLDIIYETKGAMWIDVEYRGKSAHAVEPWKGVNAIEEGMKRLEKIFKKYNNKKSDFSPTYNVAAVSTRNTFYNKLPDQAVFSLDIRFIGSPEPILKELKKENFVFNGKSYPALNKKVFPALKTKQNDKYLLDFKNIAEKATKTKLKLRKDAGFTDARYFKNAIEFGAKGGDAHSDTEYVEIKSIEKLYQAVSAFSKTQEEKTKK
ncbi:M20/M25/M40 family metallo-hydrolase [Candidatus Micrarchaeota archaeon]|nr:M20/M25/M40 family metallo-hydrolase [Candidatus Micrarchaeota archaeon]